MSKNDVIKDFRVVPLLHMKKIKLLLIYLWSHYRFSLSCAMKNVTRANVNSEGRSDVLHKCIRPYSYLMPYLDSAIILARKRELAALL